MWTAQDAAILEKMMMEYSKVPFKSRALHLKTKSRTRFRLDHALTWAKSKNYPKSFLRRLKKQYESVPKPVRWKFVKAHLLSCKMCVVCRTYIPVREDVCGRCLRTKQGQETAHELAIERMQLRWETDYHALMSKAIATSQRKYGTDFPWQNPSVIRKKKERHREKYGVDAPLQRPEVFLKNQKSRFAIKSFVFKGREFCYQGYEDIALRKAIKQFGVRNISTQFDKDYVPVELKSKVYYPDFYVKNKFYVEVKSDYTLFADFKNNVQKAIFCSENNIPLLWVVCYKPDIMIPLPKDWHTRTKRWMFSFLSKSRQV